jgi:hypothetical protein
MRTAPCGVLARFPVDAHSVKVKPLKQRNRERFRDIQHKIAQPKYVIVNFSTADFNSDLWVSSASLTRLVERLWCSRLHLTYVG